MRDAGQNQLGLEFPFMFFLQFVNRLELQAARSDDLFLNPTGFIHGFVLDVDHGIDPVLGLEWPESVLEAPSGERIPITSRGQPFQVQLGRPPSGQSVLQFQPRRGVRVSIGLWQASRRDDGNFQIAALLEVVVVGHEIRGLLC